jgi:hypothetical protein
MIVGLGQQITGIFDIMDIFSPDRIFCANCARRLAACAFCSIISL